MRIEASVVIDRPKQEVYDFLGTPSNTPTYWEHMTSYEATSPLPLGVGSTMAGELRIGPVKAPLDAVVTRVTDDVIEWNDRDKNMPTVQSFRLTEVPGGTRVTYRLDGTPQSTLARLLAPLLGVRTQRDVWKSMDNLKEILEKG